MLGEGEMRISERKPSGLFIGSSDHWFTGSMVYSDHFIIIALTLLPFAFSDDWFAARKPPEFFRKLNICSFQVYH